MQSVIRIRLLFTTVECLVKIIGSLMVPLFFRRGVRQGCLLSSQQHFLYVEAFLCLMCRRLSGLVLSGHGLVLSAYTSNVPLMLTDPDVLGRLCECQMVHSVASSARMNWAECSQLLVVPWHLDTLPE
eukprot:g13651.t1